MGSSDDWFSGGRAERPTFLRPHQKKERIPSPGRGGFLASSRRCKEVTPGEEDEYWGWRETKTLRVQWEGHSLSWRPRRSAVLEELERLITVSGTFGPRGPRGPEVARAGETRSTERRIERSCAGASSTAALAGVGAKRVVRGFSSSSLEVRCTVCGAGIVSARGLEAVGDCIMSMTAVLSSSWEGMTCRAVREHLVTLSVMES